jgi:hypothetical protein
MLYEGEEFQDDLRMPCIRSFYTLDLLRVDAALLQVLSTSFWIYASVLSPFPPPRGSDSVPRRMPLSTDCLG